MRLLDRRTFVGFVRDCSGYGSLRVQDIGVRIRIQPGGDAFDLRETLHFGLVVQGHFVQATATARFQGIRLAGAAAIAGEGPGRSLLDSAINAAIGTR